MSKTSFVTHANCLFVQNVAYPTPGDCTIFMYAVFNVCALHKCAAPGNGVHAVRNARQCSLNRKSRGLSTSFFLGHLTCRSFSSYYFMVSFVYYFYSCGKLIFCPLYVPFYVDHAYLILQIPCCLLFCALRRNMSSFHNRPLCLLFFLLNIHHVRLQYICRQPQRSHSLNLLIFGTRYISSRRSPTPFFCIVSVRIQHSCMLWSHWCGATQFI